MSQSSAPETLAWLEQSILDSPCDKERWLVYLDFCLQAGLEVGPLMALLAGPRPPELVLDREPGFDVIVSVPDPESRCTVQIRLAPAERGHPGRSLSARWMRRQPALDWVVAWPWRTSE